MGLLFNRGGKTVKELVDKGLDLADQAVTDKDKLNELQYTLMQTRAQLLLSGKGSSITKITVCGLVSLVVGVLSWTFLFHPENMKNAIDYSIAVTPLISVLIGTYGTFSALKKSKWSKDE